MRKGFLFIILAACSADKFTSDTDAAPIDGSAEASTLDASPDAKMPDIAKTPGLAFWLTPGSLTKGSSNTISVWKDVTNNGNDARPVSMSTPPDIIDSALNGYPSVRFRSNSDNQLVIADKASIQWGGDDFYVGTVVKWTNNPNAVADKVGVIAAKSNLIGASPPGIMLYGNIPNGTMAVPGVSAAVDVGHGIGKGGPYNDGSFRLMAVHRGNSTLEIRINGVGQTPSTANATADVSAPNFPFRIGSDGDAARFNKLDGEITEIIAVHAPSIPLVNIQLIEDYLRAKYKLQ